MIRVKHGDLSSQYAEELTLVTEGGGLSVPQELQRYRLDGAAHKFHDVSLGDLPNFVRKVRTEARWDGRALTLETEHFSESVDRTGFRAEAPLMLHGRPYSKTDDLVYNIDRVVYVKRTR